MSEQLAGKARGALTAVMVAWSAETLLSLAMSVALSQPGLRRQDAIVAVLTAVSALFVPVSMALAMSSGRLARASGARWTGSAGALLFGVHALLIVAQMLAPVLFGSLGRDTFGEIQRGVGGALTIARYAGWAAIAMAVQTTAGRPLRGQRLFTIAFAAGVGVAVVNVFFPRTDALWATLTQWVNLIGNVSFVIVAALARNQSPREESGAVSGPRKLGAASLLIRAIATFVVVMLGAVAGGAGVVVATGFVPVVSALLGLGFLAALAWEFKRTAPRTRALIAALGLAALSTIVDVVTSAQLARALAGATSSTGPSFGGIGWIAALAAMIAWVASMRAEAGAKGSATFLLVLGGLLGVGLAGAWANDAKTTATIALLALTAWAGLAYSMGVAMLAWRPASRIDQ